LVGSTLTGWIGGRKSVITCLAKDISMADSARSNSGKDDFTSGGDLS